MDLGDSLGILNVVVHWRIWLSVFVAALLGWLLAVTLEWMSGLQGIALPVFGFAAGFYWEGTAEGSSSEPTTTLTVAALSAAVCSCVWGAVSFKAHAAGAVLLLAGTAFWFCYAALIHDWFTNRQALVVVVSSFMAYCIVTFLLRNAA
jgi:hypothetical protein